MPVMGITHMAMGMLQLLMLMFMGMPEGAIDRGIDEVRLCVMVRVMGVAAARIVPVPMRMAQVVMAMPMAVLFPEQQHHSGGHQSRSHQECR